MKKLTLLRKLFTCFFSFYLYLSVISLLARIKYAIRDAGARPDFNEKQDPMDAVNLFCP